MVALIGALIMVTMFYAPAGLRPYVWFAVAMQVFVIFQLAHHCWYWGARMAISRPLIVDDRGLQFQMPWTTIVLPWSAVAGVFSINVLGDQVMWVTIRPDAVVGQNGVEGEPKLFRTLLKKGLYLSATSIEPGLDVVFAAIAHHSHGQVQIG